MKNDAFVRLEQLIGKEKLEYLSKASVMIVGVGGVGTYAIESLARSGIGKLILIDHDSIDISNINRQLHATHSTIGQNKVTVMKERIKDINPDCVVETQQVFLDETNIEEVFIYQPDYVVDAIDSATSKITLYKYCLQHNIPFISSLAMGNRLDSSQLRITTLAKTEYDPLARKIRYLARKDNLDLKKINVVFSLEKPLTHNSSVNDDDRLPPSSCAFVPSAAGLLAGSYVVRQLLEKSEQDVTTTN